MTQFACLTSLGREIRIVRRGDTGFQSDPGANEQSHKESDVPEQERRPMKNRNTIRRPLLPLARRRQPLGFILLLCAAFCAVPLSTAAAETIAETIKRVVSPADMPPGYQQMGPAATRDFSGFSQATADFRPQQSTTSLIQVILKRYGSAAQAEQDFNRSVQSALRRSENVIARNVGIGGGSIMTADRRYLDSANTRYETVNQSIELVHRNWLVKVYILDYNRLRSRDYSDTGAANIIKTLAAAIVTRLGGGATPAEGQDCGKSGALTLYLEALRTHQRNISALDGRLEDMLAASAPGPREVIDFGKKALQIGTAYQATLRDFQRAETRRGLFEELDLLVETPILLNQVVVKYQKLAGAPFTPLNPNALNDSWQDVSRTVLSLAREQFSSRLESEGLKDILTSDSWSEALDKTAFHAQRKVDEFLDRETERLFGIGFHDARSAERALRLQMRREIRRHVAKLLVKVTSNEIVIEIVAGPVIRWIERDLVPRLREALRQKGNIPERLARSLETMESARDELNWLRCDARLSEVRRRLDAAMGTLQATHFLERDIRNANAAASLASLDEGRNNLSRTIFLTRNRFLLVKDDYEDDLVFINNLVAQMLDNLRQSILAESASLRHVEIPDREEAIDLDLAARIMTGLEAKPAPDIPTLAARVTGVSLYEGGMDIVPLSQRVYGNKFSRSSTRAIWWELNIEYPDPGRRVDFRIDAVYTSPEGTDSVRQALDTYVLAGWTSSQHTLGWGWAAPGNWTSGVYRVDLFVGGKKVGVGTFEVIQ